MYDVYRYLEEDQVYNFWKFENENIFDEIVIKHVKYNKTNIINNICSKKIITNL